MPLFEYRCNECGRSFDPLVGVVAEKVDLRYLRCRSRGATKLVSRTAPLTRGNKFDDQDDYDDF